jgi:ABC-type glutathione transport system ATPase component
MPEMPVTRPSLGQLQQIAADFGMSMSEADLQTYMKQMNITLGAYDQVHAMPDPLPKVTYPRTPGYRPTGEENRFNAWHVKTDIHGAAGGKLSGGEQQLLALARCLCGRPRLILLDEPTEGIQPSIIAEMVDTLHQIRQATGLTMVLVEQNQNFIAALSQRVVIMQKGQLVREQTPREFLADVALV